MMMAELRTEEQLDLFLDDIILPDHVSGHSSFGRLDTVELEVHEHVWGAALCMISATSQPPAAAQSLALSIRAADFIVEHSKANGEPLQLLLDARFEELLIARIDAVLRELCATPQPTASPYFDDANHHSDNGCFEDSSPSGHYKAYYNDNPLTGAEPISVAVATATSHRGDDYAFGSPYVRHNMANDKFAAEAKCDIFWKEEEEENEWLLDARRMAFAIDCAEGRQQQEEDMEFEVDCHLGDGCDSRESPVSGSSDCRSDSEPSGEHLEDASCDVRAPVGECKIMGPRRKRTRAKRRKRPVPPRQVPPRQLQARAEAQRRALAAAPRTEEMMSAAQSEEWQRVRKVVLKIAVFVMHKMYRSANRESVRILATVVTDSIMEAARRRGDEAHWLLQAHNRLKLVEEMQRNVGKDGGSAKVADWAIATLPFKAEQCCAE